MLRVRDQVQCEGGGEIEVLGYSLVWVMSMVLTRV